MNPIQATTISRFINQDNRIFLITLKSAFLVTVLIPKIEPTEA